MQAADCEECAILEFVSPMDLGFANDQLCIVVVHDTVCGLRHAVPAAELEDGAYVLAKQFHEVLPRAGVGSA